MANRRGRWHGGTRNKSSYNGKHYSSKQKMMNIHFRYSEAVSDYATRLLDCDGRMSLILQDWSHAQLYNLDKIEFEALLAKLTPREQSALLSLPKVELSSAGSLTMTLQQEDLPAGSLQQEVVSSAVPSSASPRCDKFSSQIGSTPSQATVTGKEQVTASGMSLLQTTNGAAGLTTSSSSSMRSVNDACTSQGASPKHGRKSIT